ncbi:unnamed protein product, partial [Ectocarpus fasciculatus]
GNPAKAGEEADGGGAGSRLASLYVCLIPPLLVGVTDHPTAGANLAVVFAMCGGLLASNWGRLVRRDLRERALAEEQQQLLLLQQGHWRAESAGSAAAAAAAAAALDEDWDEEEGRGVGAAGAAAAGAGRGNALSGSKRGGVNHGVIASPSSGWSFREEEEEAESEQDKEKEHEEGEEEGEDEKGQEEVEGLVERDRAKSSSHTAGTRVLRGGGPVGGGHDDTDTSSINNDFIPSNQSSLSVLSRPRARSIGGSRRGVARRGGGSSGWTGADDNGNEPPPP